MPANEDVMKSVLILEREFIHLQEDFKCIESTVLKHDDAIRDLQDLSLTRKAEIKDIATEVIAEYTKTKSMRLQVFAPYFASLMTLIIAVIYILSNTPKP